MTETGLVADLLKTGRFLAVDTETTGVDVETDRIVSAHAATPGRPPAFDAIVDPGVEIPAAATAVHRITTARARAEGVPAAHAAAALCTALREAWAAGAVVVGFNVVFDLTLIDREAARHGLPGLGPAGACVDPLVLDRHLDRYRRGGRKLIDVCAHYGVTLEADQAHGARADARAAARLAVAMAHRYPQAFAVGTDEFQRLQAHAHRAWADHFADYLRSRGQDAADVDGEWPLRARRAELG